MQPIGDNELEFSFARSSGPGGQNVNKTSTKAQLRWHVMNSTALNDEEKQIVLKKLAHRLTQDGYIAIDSSEARTQLQNKERAIELLNILLAEALTPETPRRKTRTPYSAKLKRLDSKRKQSERKAFRKPLNLD